MRAVLCRALAGVCLFLRLSVAGPNLDSASTYQRIICVVPMVGAGTLEDPKRPEFTPIAGVASPEEDGPKSRGFSERPVILAYQSILSDDGNSAIVEFVARDRAAFKAIFKAKDQNRIKVFDRIKDRRDDVLIQLQKVKKNFDFSMLRVGAL